MYIVQIFVDISVHLQTFQWIYGHLHNLRIFTNLFTDIFTEIVTYLVSDNVTDILTDIFTNIYTAICMDILYEYLPKIYKNNTEL